MKYTKVSGDSITFICANSEIYLEDFFVDCPPTIFYADNSMSYGIKYCKPKRKAEEIPNSMISTLTWEGVDLSKESQESAPYRTDSIQYYMVQTIIEKLLIWSQ